MQTERIMRLCSEPEDRLLRLSVAAALVTLTILFATHPAQL